MSQPHPFPPVVRWAVFPSLAALAGAAAGLLTGALLSSPRWAGVWTAIGAGMGAGAALGAMVSSRAWITLLAGPIPGIALCSAVMALIYRLQGLNVTNAFEVLSNLAQSPRHLIAFLGGIWLALTAGYVSLSVRVTPSWARLLAVYGGAGAIAAAIGHSTLSADERLDMSVLLFLAVLSQAAPFRASLALAARLRPRSAP